MINAIISGCSGKMGQVITKLVGDDPDMQVVAGFDKNSVKNNTFPVFSRPRNCSLEADVIIDFSVPEALEPLLEYAVFKKVPLVIATTGFSQIQTTRITKASKIIPIFRSANMSLGINLVLDLVIKAAKVLEENFDIEILEKHHNQKIDAPSGTALMLADSINSVLSHKNELVYERASERAKRSKNEIGIHSLRGGTIVGEHSVIFAGNDEIIEVSHATLSRNVFGMGALKAAKYIVDKEPGLYSMKTLISEQ